MRFNSYEVLEKFLKEKGYDPKFLLKNINNDPPNSFDIINTSWYPFIYFRMHGTFDSLSIMYFTFLLTQDATNPKLALQYCKWSPYILSYNKCVLYVFKYIQESSVSYIILPFGGIPYYVPVNKSLLVLDPDETILSYLKSRPKCNYILGPKGDIRERRLFLHTDMICCMRLSYYLKDYNQLKNMINVFYEWLNMDGILLLNLVIRSEKYQSYKKIHRWQKEIITGLNNNNKFMYYFPTPNEIKDALSYKFKMVSMEGDYTDLNYMLILKKI